MKIIPVEYKCLIELEEIEKVSAGGILLPESAKETAAYRQEVGTLLACGSRAFEDWGVGNIPKIGDRILINKYSGATIQLSVGARMTLRLVNDKDITAILEEDDG